MEEISWTQEQLLEVGLNEPDDFLKVRETLSRIGVASRKERNLLQDWGLIQIMSESSHEAAPLSQIKILTYKEKNEWLLETKYNIGKKRET